MRSLDVILRLNAIWLFAKFRTLNVRFYMYVCYAITLRTLSFDKCNFNFTNLLAGNIACFPLKSSLVMLKSFVSMYFFIARIVFFSRTSWISKWINIKFRQVCDKKTKCVNNMSGSLPHPLDHTPTPSLPTLSYSLLHHPLFFLSHCNTRQ